MTLKHYAGLLGFNRVRVVDPYDLATVETAVTEELAAKEPNL